MEYNNHTRRTMPAYGKNVNHVLITSNNTGPQRTNDKSPITLPLEAMAHPRQAR
jgi:hypothetical protein